MKIPLNQIRANPAISVREYQDEDTILRYMEVLDYLPPITVFRIFDHFLLVDGFHRLSAASRLGWLEIEAVVKEGSYEDAAEYAITANLTHGMPLTSQEYEIALIRLKKLHPDWTQQKLAATLSRSQQWVSKVFAANNVDNICAATTDTVEKIYSPSKLDTSTKAEIARAPKQLWPDICQAVLEHEWTHEATRKIVQAINAEPSRAQEILHSEKISISDASADKLIPIPEAPADKLIPLTKDINKLCEMLDPLCSKLDPTLYDWGSGALATHVLHGLYILAEKIPKLADSTKRLIEFLETR